MKSTYRFVSILVVYVGTTISYLLHGIAPFSKSIYNNDKEYCSESYQFHQSSLLPSASTLHSIRSFSLVQFMVKPSQSNPTAYDDISDEDWYLVSELALGEDHVKELTTKVEIAIQNDWDVRQGVVSQARSKPVLLKANIDMWSYNAKQQLRKGNFSGATMWYEKCIEYNPRDGRSWLGLAQLQWKKGKPDLAEKYYKEGLSHDGKNPFLLQGYAVLLEKLGRITPALDLLTKSVKYCPTHSASWVALARLHQRSSRFDEAQFCFAAALENDPKSYVALQAWGVLEGELGNVDKARELFQKAISISHESAHTYQAWATLEKRQGRLDEAIRLLNESLVTFPENTRTRVTYAEILELQGYVKETRDTFRLGENYAARSGDAGFFQSWALFENRQIQSMIMQRRRRGYSSSSNNNNNNNINSGSDGSSDDFTDNALYSSLNNMVLNENSTPTASTITSSNTDTDTTTWLETAYSNVRRLFKRAVTVNKYHSASWVAWAKFEQQLGNYEVARKLLIAGISKFPHSRNIGWFHCALANLARKEGDLNTARACYTRALSSTPTHKSLPILMEYASMEADTNSIIANSNLKSSTADVYEEVSRSTTVVAQETTSAFFRMSQSKREKDAAVAESIKEARRLFEMTVKRFPNEKRAWDAYFDFESRHQAGPQSNSGSSSSSSRGSSGGRRDKLRELSERRHVALNTAVGSGVGGKKGDDYDDSGVDIDSGGGSDGTSGTYVY